MDGGLIAGHLRGRETVIGAHFFANGQRSMKAVLCPKNKGMRNKGKKTLMKVGDCRLQFQTFVGEIAML